MKMELVLSKKMAKFFGLMEKFAEGVDEEEYIMISIELHVAGTTKTLKWEMIEKSHLVKDAMTLQALQESEVAKE